MKKKFVKQLRKELKIKISGILLGFILVIAASLLFIFLKVKTNPNIKPANIVIPPYYHQEAFKIPEEIKSTPEATNGAKLKVPILMYHYIEYVQDKNDTTRQKLDLNPNIFEQQLKTLTEAEFTPIFIKDLASVLDKKKDLPKKPIILTFDDGYRDFYTVAFSILKKYQIKSTIYVVSEFLDKPNYLTTDQLKELAESPLIEVASHTLHHVGLKGTSDQVAIKEIANSKLHLESLLGIPIVDFAYPYGSFSAKTIEIVKQTGYLTAASVIPGMEHSQYDRFFLYRLRPGGRIGKELINFLEKDTTKK